jgi:transposase
MSENEIIKAYNEGINSVIELVKGLTQTINELNAKVSVLDERVESLESQTKKNSKNSSKPPSSDGFKKTKSLRKPSGKKPGGQEGHIGSTLQQVENPDEVIEYMVNECSQCGASLKNATADRYIVRQVFEIPEIKIKVTEHRIEVKKCICGKVNTGKISAQLTQPTQYGNRLKSLIVYLNQYQLLPFERLQEMFNDLFGQNISQGTLVSASEACYNKLESVEENIKQVLKDSNAAVHFDETGVSVNGKLKWLHVTSDRNYTYYSIHDKRGSQAMDDIDILPEFNGTAVHDSWRSYNKYTNCDHALCCAHILRELNGIIELEKQNWAKDMKDLLLNIKLNVDNSSSNSNALTLDKIIHYERLYDDIISKGIEEDFKLQCVKKTVDNTKKKSRKKSKSGNLLERLSLHKQEVLTFMNDFEIPFDNNLAERDLRMTKVKQKISGTFRSSYGADRFARIRGYISTIKKHKANVLDAIASVFEERSIDPTLV